MTYEDIPPRAAAQSAQTDAPQPSTSGPDSRAARITQLALRARAAWTSGDNAGHQRAWVDLMDEAIPGMLRVVLRKLDEDQGYDVVAESFIDFIRVIRGEDPI